MSPARVLLALLAFALVGPFAINAQEIGSTFGPLPVFEFHSGFWINLHHTLYYEARLRLLASNAGSMSGSPATSQMKTMKDSSTPLSPSEQIAWSTAVAYYAEKMAGKDLLFNNDMVLLKNELGDLEDCADLSGARKKACDAGLPAALTRVLDEAAPVYRAHLWPEHDRANRQWVARVAPLIVQQGVDVSERLAFVYQTKWPAEKIRVDVSAYANNSGAYTTLDPLRVTISSTDPRNQGDRAFEVLFHEASHGIAEPVQQAIIRECRQREKAIPRDLWPALILYTTGEVIQPMLASGGGKTRSTSGGATGAGSGPVASTQSSRSTYTVREDLSQRGWDEYYALLVRFWQPYLDGSAGYDDAIARIVSSF
ncbi:MAG TPA: hypothetical protein VJN93_14925 [Candidatus Acidoferrum sp.]|nr:hypothetical protein [Candidatus Acidoferrum sp.]